MNRKINLFFLMLVLPILSFAQVKGARGTYIWPSYTQVEIPDSLKSEDAFFIENITTYDFREGFETHIIVFKRIYINSEAAAEDLSQQELFLGRSGTLPVLKARTLKASGEVLDLEGDQIIETVSEKKNQYGSESVRRIQFVYPNVEVGDVIDLVYKISLDGYVFSDLLYLEDEIPSMHSRITLRNFSLLDLSVYRLNDSPPIQSKMVSGSQVIDWQKTGVKTIQTDYFNALPPDHPSLVFVLWRRGESLNYRTWYEANAVDLPDNYEVFTSIEKIFIEQGVIEEGANRFLQLQSIIRYLENECLWTDAENIFVNKTIKSLMKQEVNETLFFRYVMKFLNEKEIRFERGYTKSLLKGKFEHGFVSLEQLSHSFLVIYDMDDVPHFLFPPRGDHQFYYLDEIPYYLEGNQSISLFGERGFLKEAAQIQLPESGNKNNSHMAQVKIKLNRGEEMSSYSRKDKLTGHYSFLTRDGLGSIWKEELGIAPDSIEVLPTWKDGQRTKSAYPYQVEFYQKEREESFFQTIDDSIGWMDISSLLPLGVYQVDETESNFGDYLVLPFIKKHSVSIFVQNENSLSIAEDVHSIEISNDIGDVKIELFQVNDKVVKIQLNIEVKKRYLKGQEVDEFKELLQQYSEIRSKKWLLKM